MLRTAPPTNLHAGNVLCGTLCSIAGWRCTQYDGIVAWAVCELLGRGCGGWFDDFCHVGRRHRPCSGGPAGDRLWNSDQGIQYRQHPYYHRRDGRLHRRDHVRALDRRQGAEERRAKARSGRGADGWRSRNRGCSRRRESDFASGRGQPAAPQAGSAPPVAPPPWQDEDVLRDHPIPEPMFPEDTAPPPPQAPKQKRNLFFSSMSRQERERAQSRTSEPLPLDMLSSDLRPGPPATNPPEPQQPAQFSDAWTRPDRARPGEMPPRRGARAPMSFDEDERRTIPKRGSAGRDDPEVGHRRWHGLFAVFRRLDRGPDAGGPDALRLDRRVACAPG